MRKIGIIGGGASGLAAAITAAAGPKNIKIFILEHKEQAGKKLLSTGNGRCNLTNERMDSSFFRSEEIRCVEKVLEQFDASDTIHFFEELGLMMRSRNGYIYPRCEQASAVRELLVKEAERRGVVIYTNIHVTEIVPGKKGFQVFGRSSDTKDLKKRRFSFDKLILACGGRAAKVLGSDGSGYTLAKNLGHTIVPVVPALVQLKVKEHPFKEASGVRTEAGVSAYIAGEKICRDTGELQITNYGISGIPVFQISRYVARALYEKRRVEVEIDLLPSMSEDAFFSYLIKRRIGKEAMQTGDFLAGIFHSRLTACLLARLKIPVLRPAGELSEREIIKFVKQCKHSLLSIQDTTGYDNAQACAGGISLGEVDCVTMESRYVKGLYLTGELLDADGMCGGYNLQWAWATGILAGRHIISEIDMKQGKGEKDA